MRVLGHACSVHPSRKIQTYLDGQRWNRPSLQRRCPARSSSTLSSLTSTSKTMCQKRRRLAWCGLWLFSLGKFLHCLLGKSLHCLLHPAVVITGVPAFPSLSVLSLSQMLPGLESPDPSFTQRVVDGVGQLILFKDELSQANLRIPDDDPSQGVSVFAD